MTTHAARDTSAVDGPRQLLTVHHRNIEIACAALQASEYTDDWLEVVSRYRTLENAVLEHLKAEEAIILPIYSEYAAAEAESIRTTHDELRRELFRIGVEVELHCVQAESLERLVTALREHVKHEDSDMYTWAQVHLPLRGKRELYQRIKDSLLQLGRMPDGRAH